MIVSGALACLRTAMKTTARSDEDKSMVGIDVRMCLVATPVFAKMIAGLAASAFR